MQLLYLLDNEFSDLKTKIAALFSLGRGVFFNDHKDFSQIKKSPIISECQMHVV